MTDHADNITANQLIDTISRMATTSNLKVVGVCGPPAAGKTTIATVLAQTLNHIGIQTVPVSADGWHLSGAQLAAQQLTDKKGAPDTFDVDGLAATLQRLRASTRHHNIYLPNYDRVIHEPIAARTVAPPETQIVVLEGNYLLCDRDGWGTIGAMLDCCLYVDTPAKLRHERLTNRHHAGGKTLRETNDWIRRIDTPNTTLVEQSRSHATWTCDGQSMLQNLTYLSQPCP